MGHCRSHAAGHNRLKAQPARPRTAHRQLQLEGQLALRHTRPHKLQHLPKRRIADVFGGADEGDLLLVLHSAEPLHRLLQRDQIRPPKAGF